ncbi:ferrochelatase [Candidatus Thioglobus sp.]|jgi:ferrochelatase|uniref:ferrochelatase n=1 Tax=Candidatus Thioglobus sp. TaxID=2026721 RepID=UPI001772E6B7|nr:ferrochelatase [Candidatus Thioglobus sp.]HIF48135.1 ferrochelatase [Candidatus Thioglobus sp.]HIL03505.1 ferrochelatase [Candidatus Thioglobus autotrophicus]
MKTGILLTNLGTPDEPTKSALKRYLSEFLSDPRVVDPPNKLVWWLALNIVILNIRPKKSALNYAKIWDSFGSGSPLLNITQSQLDGVKKVLSEQDSELEFAMGMRYGNPSIAHALNQLKAKGCDKIIVLPLYPQYSKTTTLSTLDAVNLELETWSSQPEIVFIEHYYQNRAYIKALRDSVTEYQAEHGQPNKLLISFHGIPQRYVDNGDIYYQHCLQTADLLAESLNLQAHEWQASFQSIFGREEWTKPYTKDTLESLAQSGVENVQVVCPGFSADCLETLEEIDDENRGYFMDAGGKTFAYIPALNTRKDHIDAIINILSEHL